MRNAECRGFGRHWPRRLRVEPGFRSWEEQRRRQGAKQNAFGKQPRFTLPVKPPCWRLGAQSIPAQLRVLASLLFNGCFQVETSTNAWNAKGVFHSRHWTPNAGRRVFIRAHVWGLRPHGALAGRETAADFPVRGEAGGALPRRRYTGSPPVPIRLCFLSRGLRGPRLSRA
jgi:hypothetical protein